jgi:hypothetical protein
MEEQTFDVLPHDWESIYSYISAERNKLCKLYLSHTYSSHFQGSTYLRNQSQITSISPDASQQAFPSHVDDEVVPVNSESDQVYSTAGSDAIGMS